MCRNKDKNNRRYRITIQIYIYMHYGYNYNAEFTRTIQTYHGHKTTYIFNEGKGELYPMVHPSFLADTTRIMSSLSGPGVPGLWSFGTCLHDGSDRRLTPPAWALVPFRTIHVFPLCGQEFPPSFPDPCRRAFFHSCAFSESTRPQRVSGSTIGEVCSTRLEYPRRCQRKSAPSATGPPVLRLLSCPYYCSEMYRTPVISFSWGVQNLLNPDHHVATLWVATLTSENLTLSMYWQYTLQFQLGISNFVSNNRWQHSPTNVLSKGKYMQRTDLGILN